MRLVEDILDISNIVAGELRLERKPVDIPSTLRAVVDSQAETAASKHQSVTVELAPGVGQTIGDPGRMRQVFGNLLANAIKFTPDGGAIEVKATQSDDRIEVRVSDNGPGLPASFVPHAFEPFRQADSSTTRAYSGLGLGLAIVRRLVELQGGRVMAQGHGEKGGATFVLTLRGVAPGHG
jgi:signal transduction histidine kinase